MNHTHSLVIGITGASGGVGRALARRLARRKGIKLGLVARGRQGLEGAKREVEEAGAEGFIVTADVADHAQTAAAIDRIEQALGPIDIWINNAMTTVFGPFLTISPEEFKRVTEVAYLGYVYGAREALKRMIPRNRGSIVQVGSSIAYRGIPLQTAYSGAKHAIQGFTEALRAELMHDGVNIHLTMVQLPAVNTPQFDWCKNTTDRAWQPVPPIFEPDLVARAIEWAAFHKKREVYVGETTYKAIWADKLIPGFVDYYLAKTGHRSQWYDGANDPHKPSNLWRPIDEDRGAQGGFSARTRKTSPQIWALTHPKTARTLLMAAAALAAGGATIALRKKA
jgi:short-subunit dehydrogenase